MKKRLPYIFLNIVFKMQEELTDKEFVRDTVALAIKYEGVRDLMVLWSEETDENEKTLIINDIRDIIEESAKDLK